MITIQFGYERKKVLQALRYHFISRPEIRIMLIIVNVFAILSIVLYAFKVVQPLAFLVGSFLWLMLMVSFWFILPFSVYKRAITFRHEFEMDFSENEFTLRHDRGSKTWPWSALKKFVESPHFFHLYFDSRSFLLVPKSGFRDSDEVHELRMLMKKKLPAP
jgi:hypothetical protein